ncbi:MAG: TlpA family protein disulfide reductase [Blastocatellia bacterium]|nr:TlpA family protein disulfide reductase [Blastocatellia bacterium]
MFLLWLRQAAQETAIVTALSAAILFTLAGCGAPRLTSPPAIPPEPAPGVIADAVPQAVERMPIFEVKDTSGRKISSKTLAGKVVLLDFWATWCPPCRKEIPHFNRLYAKYKDRGMIIFGLALDENEGEVAAFARQFPIEYPVALASKQLQQKFGGIEVYPTAFLFDRDGKLVKKYLGFTYPDEFEQDVESLIGQHVKE